VLFAEEIAAHCINAICDINQPLIVGILQLASVAYFRFRRHPNRNISVKCVECRKEIEKNLGSEKNPLCVMHMQKKVFFGIIVLALLIGCEKKPSMKQSVSNTIKKVSYSQAAPPSGMVYISAGIYKMGNSKITAYDERPLHEVAISPLFIDSTEATQEDYEKLIGFNPSRFKGTNTPVVNVSWYDAILYCNQRSKRDGFDTIYSLKSNSDFVTIDFNKIGYRLPTEAEWEYACKAGTATEFYWGKDVGRANLFEWACDTTVGPHAVAQKLSNPWKLYDMLTNVSEWCSDWYDEKYYNVSPNQNPHGPDNGEERVVRGFYCMAPSTCSSRDKRTPNNSDATVGFRCILPILDSLNIIEK
jgi:formylglycine-generating enzyme required for sulfatase activity